MISIRYSPKNKRAKTKTLIRVSVCYGQRLVFSTRQSIDPKLWDYRHGIPKNSAKTKDIVRELNQLKTIIADTYFQLSTNTSVPAPQVLKRNILKVLKGDYPNTDVNTPLTVALFFDEFIKDCENGKRVTKEGTRMSDSSIKPFRTTKKHWTDFEEGKRPLSLEKFGQEDHDSFLDYLEVDLGMSRNSTSKYMMCIQQLLKWGVKKKLIRSSQINELEYATRREESDNIYLNERELEFVQKLENLSKMEQTVRDLFLLGCYTGLRFSDYSTLTFENIQGNEISLIQTKTKEKLNIPVHPIVGNVVRKYNYRLPKSPTNQEFNRTLKDICQRVPELHVEFSKQMVKGREHTVINKKKWEMVMTHTARRSFCTNLYNKGVPVKTIMTFSGHKSEKNFHKYIKASHEDHMNILRGVWDKETFDKR